MLLNNPTVSDTWSLFSRSIPYSEFVFAFKETAGNCPAAQTDVCPVVLLTRPAWRDFHTIYGWSCGILNRMQDPRRGVCTDLFHDSNSLAICSPHSRHLPCNLQQDFQIAILDYSNKVGDGPTNSESYKLSFNFLSHCFPGSLLYFSAWLKVEEKKNPQDNFQKRL